MSDMDLSFLAAYMTTRSDIEVEIFALDLSLLKEVPTAYPRPGIWEKKTNLTKCGVPDESILVGVHGKVSGGALVQTSTVFSETDLSIGA